MKNWIPPNFHWEKEGYFSKNGFFLISIIVFTSRNKSCKILFWLREIVFLSFIVFLLLMVTFVEIMQKPIFTEKQYILSRGNVFLNEFLILSCGSVFFFFNLFFLLQVETFSEIIGKKFIWERLCSSRMETVFFYTVLLSWRRNH